MLFYDSFHISNTSNFLYFLKLDNYSIPNAYVKVFTFESNLESKLYLNKYLYKTKYMYRVLAQSALYVN